MATKIKVIYTVAADFVIDTDDQDEAIAAGDQFTARECLNDGSNTYVNLDQVQLADDPIPDRDEQVYNRQGELVSERVE